jgi:4-amino-4-deoxy-L-arabinose transferase-like glycosyltransferase
VSAVLDPPVALDPAASPQQPEAAAADPRWVRPSLVALLSATGLLYLWDLSASGWANAFYAAAAQAGSQSWEAFFYGSSDAANAITVDKPPASLWVMGAAVRLFGLSSWSVLVPQALMGVATVGVVYLAVRRVVGPGAGLLAGAVLATTPVAALMFRFDNPDALLVLLLTTAGYALVRATETASRRWLVAVGVLIGFAFLAKMLQALLVVPGFALVYLVAARTTLRARMGHLLLAGVALVAAAGWWVAVVELVPTDWRPYIGGSQTNSVWELVWGYNGLGRLTGDETGSVGGAAGWGSTGVGRLFGVDIGGQVAWLLPAALLLLVGGLVAVGRAPRTDRTRAALLTWGGWLLVTGAVFSLMAGIFHAYYTVALAPAVAVLVGIGGGLLWERRGALWPRVVLAVTTVTTAAWSWVLLSRTPLFLPWLRWVVLVAGVVAGLGLLLAHLRRRSLLVGVVATALLAGLGGPAAYAAQTAVTPHTGAIPSAGPTASGGFLHGGHVAFVPRVPHTSGGTAGHPVTTSSVPRAGSGIGNLLDAGTPSAAVTELLRRNASSYTWVAATIGSNSAAGFQLASGHPVMALGGFNGSDPAPTLTEFQQDVADGEVHWFIAGGVGMASSTGSDEAHHVQTWVEAHYASTVVDGVTLYDLSRPPTS